MLTTLSIKNYALIEYLQVDFQDKLSIITGETGAGKSIILGALALVLGKRVDASLVNNKEKKCVIEAEFAIDKYNLKTFFEQEDLDYDKKTIIRREVLPNGKSRAFINDTPTTLLVLNRLSSQLIDIHSQHETLQLAESDFQFKIIDALSTNEENLVSYKKDLILFNNLNKTLEDIIESHKKSKETYDYNLFILNELIEADFKENEQEELETNFEKLNHIEEIKLNLSEAIQISDEEQIGLKDMLSKFKNNIDKISTYSKKYTQLSERLDSLFIEFKDIVEEIEDENEQLDYNASALEQIENRLQLIYSLQKKHAVNTIKELLVIQKLFHDKVIEVNSVKDIISAKENEIESAKNRLEKIALKIHLKRVKAIPVFIKKMELILNRLEMKNTKFSINLVPSNNWMFNGKETLEFLISTNKGHSFEPLKKVASGGEISRIMLSVKLILSKYANLPAIIFDEIDTGVSGEVSNKIAELMYEMGDNMQVIAITHLPQIAAKGNQHYKVYKEENKHRIYTNIKLLRPKERVEEIAEMLGGKKITDSALAHAKQLLT